MSGKKIIDGLKQAVAGDLARVTIDGQVWVRQSGKKPKKRPVLPPIKYDVEGWYLSNVEKKLDDLVEVTTSKSGGSVEVSIEFDTNGLISQKFMDAFAKEVIEIFFTGDDIMLRVDDTGFEFWLDGMSREYIIPWENVFCDDGGKKRTRAAFEKWFNDKYGEED